MDRTRHATFSLLSCCINMYTFGGNPFLYLLVKAQYTQVSGGGGAGGEAGINEPFSWLDNINYKYLKMCDLLLPVNALSR
jgi:hypothetical protein